MRHPTEGVLRRLVDEPVGVADLDRRHVADCTHCLASLTAAQQDGALVGAALSMATDPDVDAAWERLTAGPMTVARPAPVPRESRWREALRRPAAAALAVTVVLAGAGTAAANDWLQIFRTERVAPVSFSTQDLLALPDLSAYGDLELSGEPNVRSVSSAEAAETVTGLEVPEVAALPDGVAVGPVYQVGDRVSATFTFSAERAAAATGGPLPPVPAGLDGSSVRLDVGPGVAQVWTSNAGVPALVVGRATAPTAYSTGVPFETVRDYLLSLPGLPAEVARQLRGFAADGSTLPVPVPTEYATSSTAEVNGAVATVLSSRDRSLAAVVWVQDGLVTVVAGALDADELLDVARGLE